MSTWSCEAHGPSSEHMPCVSWAKRVGGSTTCGYPLQLVTAEDARPLPCNCPCNYPCRNFDGEVAEFLAKELSDTDNITIHASSAAKAIRKARPSWPDPMMAKAWRHMQGLV